MPKSGFNFRSVLLLMVFFGLAAVAATRPSFAADDPINGTWAGRASNGSASFDIALQIKNGTFGMSVMNWGTGQCVGNLFGGAQGNNTYVYTLRITKGRRTKPEEAGCVDGTVRLVYDGVKSVRYTWNGSDLDGRAVSSSAVLEKQ